jgi:hypothetical protein
MMAMMTKALFLYFWNRAFFTNLLLYLINNTIFIIFGHTTGKGIINLVKGGTDYA